MGYRMPKPTPREPTPPGVYQAVHVDIIDRGMQESDWGGHKKIQPKVDRVWLTKKINPKTNRPYRLVKRYTASLYERAQLRQDLEAEMGRPLTPDEENDENILETRIGSNVMLSVINVTKNGKVYDNISSMMPLMEGLDPIEIPADFVRFEKPEAEENGGDDEPVPF